MSAPATLLGGVGGRIAGFGTRPVAHRVLVQALPAILTRRFDPAHADGLETTMELRVRSPGGAMATPFTITITGGACAVTPGAAERPRAGAELGGDDLIRLATGTTGWPTLLAEHRLTMFGDPFTALRLPLLFRLPSS